MKPIVLIMTILGASLTSATPVLGSIRGSLPLNKCPPGSIATCVPNTGQRCIIQCAGKSDYSSSNNQGKQYSKSLKKPRKPKSIPSPPAVEEFTSADWAEDNVHFGERGLTHIQTLSARALISHVSRQVVPNKYFQAKLSNRTIGASVYLRPGGLVEIMLESQPLNDSLQDPREEYHQHILSQLTNFNDEPAIFLTSIDSYPEFNQGFFSYSQKVQGTIMEELTWVPLRIKTILDRLMLETSPNRVIITAVDHVHETRVLATIIGAYFESESWVHENDIHIIFWRNLWFGSAPTKFITGLTPHINNDVSEMKMIVADSVKLKSYESLLKVDENKPTTELFQEIDEFTDITQIHSTPQILRDIALVKNVLMKNYKLRNLIREYGRPALEVALGQASLPNVVTDWDVRAY